MRPPDLIRFARDAATGNPLRTVLLILAMAIGVGAVVVLTALGDGARWMAPWFARPKAWQVLDGMIGLTMLTLATLLVRHAMGGG